MKRYPITKLIDSVVRCTICKAEYGECDCWTKCECGWSYEKNTKCGNPECKSNLWSRMEKGWYINEIMGGICQERDNKWYFYPNDHHKKPNRKGSFKTLQEAKENYWKD